jgi:protein-L-isoaspartate(D-aspartate) O-methyltransferase
MEDNFRHRGLRQKLVEELRGKGIESESVLEAIGKVPRHTFMESSFVDLAYKDQAFPIAVGQTISQPYTVAVQTQLLNVQKHDKILEIGTGSGYQAAVLAEMQAVVYTIERQRELFLKAQLLLPKLGYMVNFFFGDGYDGLLSYAPFDKILITAGAPEIPQKLLQQLRIGGCLVMPFGNASSQKMIRIVKESENQYNRTEHGSFIFVPMLKGRVNGKNGDGVNL